MQNFMEEFGIPACVVVIVLAAVVGGAYGIVNYSCGNLQEVSGFPTKVVGLTCYVEDPTLGAYVPTNNWRVQ